MLNYNARRRAQRKDKASLDMEQKTKEKAQKVSLNLVETLLEIPFIFFLVFLPSVVDLPRD